MQINGTGIHQSELHHVTNCMHDHKHSLDGKMASPSSSTSTATQPTQSKIEQQMQPSFSLSAWVQNTLSGTQAFIFKLFGIISDKESGHTKQNGSETLAPIIPAGNAEPHISQMEVASTIAQPPQTININPHFVPIQENITPLQRIKMRFQNIAGSLTGFMAKHFSFSNNSSFQARQERPKEDLSRHSRFRKDELEIDCIITDDSFLMDSYNDKGEYSKLSSKNTY